MLSKPQIYRPCSKQWPMACFRPAPMCSLKMGNRACSTPIRATKTVMYKEEPTDNAANASGELRPATKVSVTPKPITAI